MDCKSGNIASSTNDVAASPIEGSILGCFVSSVEIELNSCGLLSILLVGRASKNCVRDVILLGDNIIRYYGTF